MNIVCFGDSNTFGYDPRGFFGGRYDMPWPELLATFTESNTINLGENGREIPKSTVNFPINTDLIILMLGTNDLLQGNSADTTANRMEAFLSKITTNQSHILLIAPPPMKPGTWVTDISLINESIELVNAYQKISHLLGIRFANAAEWNISLAFDGVHFTEAGHRTFAECLCQYLNRKADEYVSE